MRKIGVTGSIATGKSTLLEAFARAGAPVFSADAAVAELYAGEAVAPVEALFPGVTRNGIIDRQALAQRLGADPSRFARLAFECDVVVPAGVPQHHEVPVQALRIERIAFLREDHRAHRILRHAARAAELDRFHNILDRSALSGLHCRSGRLELRLRLSRLRLLLLRVLTQRYSLKRIG